MNLLYGVGFWVYFNVSLFFATVFFCGRRGVKNGRRHYEIKEVSGNVRKSGKRILIEKVKNN